MTTDLHTIRIRHIYDGFPAFSIECPGHCGTTEEGEPFCVQWLDEGGIESIAPELIGHGPWIGTVHWINNEEPEFTQEP